MFGFKNFTGISFVGKVGQFGVEFAAEIVEEVTFNVTAANAAEIPDNLNLNLISKDQIITTTSIAVSSKILENNIFGLIAGATPNLFI